jgi:hypothetical protein
MAAGKFHWKLSFSICERNSEYFVAYIALTIVNEKGFEWDRSDQSSDGIEPALFVVMPSQFASLPHFDSPI